MSQIFYDKIELVQIGHDSYMYQLKYHKCMMKVLVVDRGIKGGEFK